MVKNQSELQLGNNVHDNEQNIWESIYLPANIKHEGTGIPDAIIAFILSGSIQISLEQYGRHIFTPGQMVLWIPGCAYKVEVLEPLHYVRCHFNMESVLSSYSSVSQLLPFCKGIDYEFCKLNICEALSDFLHLIDSYVELGLNSTYLFELKRKELFSLLFLCYSKIELANFFYPLIGHDPEFREFILSNFMQVKSVKELASLANYSTSGFIKKFQLEFKEPPYKWIARNKAERIKEDLINRNLSLQEMAYKYNFSTYQRFTDFCKAQFGLPPSKIMQFKT